MAGRTLEEHQRRVWERISKRPPWECWPWEGGITPAGYGQIAIDGRMQPAHRVVWIWTHGNVETGLHVDHKCHNADPACPGGACQHRRCVNPAHLEPVTPLENQRRGMAQRGLIEKCPNGHTYADVGVYVAGPSSKHPGKRQCKACGRAQAERYQAKKKGTAA